MAKIKEIVEVRHRTKKQAKDNRIRVDKKARIKPRPPYYTYRERPGVKRNGTYTYGYI